MLKNFSTRITILVFLVILIILVGLTLIAQRTQQEGTTSLTPTPSSTPQSGGTPSGSSKQHSFTTAQSRLPTDRKTRFDAFVKKLPHSDRDFDAEYVSQLNAVVVYIKNPKSTAALRAYLNSENVLDIYLSGSTAIISSTKPIETTTNLLLNKDTFERDEEGTVQGVSISSNPWLKKFPIDKPTYTISFDNTSNTIIVEYKTSTADSPATRAEIRSVLELAGVPLNTYPITYVTLE